MKQSKTVTIVIDGLTVEKMRQFYEDDLVTSTGPYQLLLIKREKLSITVYQSKKTTVTHKVVFQGSNPLSEARLWDPSAKEVVVSDISINTIKQNRQIYLRPHYGSDEVGNGSFFGPVIVVSTFLNDKTLKLVKSYKVDDSKKMTDERIMNIAPKLIKYVDYHQFTVSNAKYNQLIKDGYNLNAIKARLHYQALINIKKKVYEPYPFFVDQFCSKKKFYSYLDNMDKLDGNIIFETKAEQYYPAVATSSVIARYLFLKQIEALSKQYQTKLPIGVSKDVDQFAIEFIKKHGMETFNKISKHHFKNYKRIIDAINE